MDIARVIMIAVEVGPEGEEVWSKVWPSVLEKYRQQPGLHRVIMLRDVDDPRRYTLLVECDSRSHANAAGRSQNSGRERR
jgi:heme-degrading monooxygenase HmoA